MIKPARTILLTASLVLTLSPWAMAQTPGLTGFTGGLPATSGSDQLYGWEFTANDTISVDALGVYDFYGASGLTISHDVGIYDMSTQALLGSTTIPAGAGPTLLNGFEYEDVTPFSLTMGDNYVIVMTMPQQNLDDQYIDVSSETTASQITYDTSAFDSGSTLAYPTIYGAFAPGMFGPNFTFESAAATPEPASFALFGSGLLALGMLAYYRRRAANQNGF